MNRIGSILFMTSWLTQRRPVFHLAATLTAAIVVGGMTAAAEATETLLGGWTFETSQPTTAGPHVPEEGLYTAFSQATAFHATGTTTYNSPTGNLFSAHSFNSDNWTTAGDYYQFQSSTAGATGIKLYWDQTRSSTGPENFKLQYSQTGVGTFTDLLDYTVHPITWPSTPLDPPDPLWPLSWFSFDASAVSGLANLPIVFFRLTSQNAVPLGESRIDNFRIFGSLDEGEETQTYYWTGQSAGNWNDLTKWSLSNNVPSPTPTTPPRLEDTVVFNISPENGPDVTQKIQLDSLASTEVSRMVFETARDTTILSGGQGMRLQGDPNAGNNAILLQPTSGNVSINSGIRLLNSQSWINDSSSLLSVAAPFGNYSFNISLDNHELTIGGAGDTTIVGLLGPFDPGSLIKTGTGTLRFGGYLTNLNISNGVVQIQRNSLNANHIDIGSDTTLDISAIGYVSVDTVDIADGGILNLHDGGGLFAKQIAGNLVNDGGNFFGVGLDGSATINGNYSQSTSGSLGANMVTHDLDTFGKLEITGTALLAGRLEMVFLPDPNLDWPLPGEEIEILTAGGGVNGQFSAVISPTLQDVSQLLGKSIAFQPIYFADSVKLRAVQPSNEIQFDATTQSANWSAATTWSTRELPQVQHIIAIYNKYDQNGAEQVVEVDVPIATTFKLTVADPTDPIRVNVANGSLLTAQTEVSIGSYGTIELQAGGSLDAGVITVKDGGKLIGSGTLRGGLVTAQSGGLIELNGGKLESDYIQIQNGGMLSLTNLDVAAKTSIFVSANGQVELHNSSLQSDSVYIESGGMLVGNGRVSSTKDPIISNGTLRPGFSVGRLEIEGQFEQTNSGTLLVDVEGANLNQFDVLDVTGTVTLDGTLVIDASELNTNTPGTTVTILTAGQGIAAGTKFKSVETIGSDDRYFAPTYFADYVDVRDYPIGDMNRDRVLSSADIDLFALGLMNPDAYFERMITPEDGDPYCLCVYPSQSGNMDGLNGLDFDDIDDFAQALEMVGVNNALAAVQDALAGVPEPSTMTLAAFGVLGSFVWRRNRRPARGNCTSNATRC